MKTERETRLELALQDAEAILMEHNLYSRKVDEALAAVPSVPEVSLPEITPALWEQFEDTCLMTWHDGPQWTQHAVDFVSAIKMGGWYSLEELEERDRANAQSGEGRAPEGFICSRCYGSGLVSHRRKDSEVVAIDCPVCRPLTPK